MSNKVLITNDQNVVKVPSGLRILIRRSCNAVLDFEHFDGPAEISVTFVDNNRIHELNKEYRDKDSATDVLSFPLGENGEYDIDEDNGCKLLGAIVISMERAKEQAALYGRSLRGALSMPTTAYAPPYGKSAISAFICVRRSMPLWQPTGRSCLRWKQL